MYSGDFVIEFYVVVCLLNLPMHDPVMIHISEKYVASLNRMRLPNPQVLIHMKLIICDSHTIMLYSCHIFMSDKTRGEVGAKHTPERALLPRKFGHIFARVLSAIYHCE